jgi:hypothetical protein
MDREKQNMWVNSLALSRSDGTRPKRPKTQKR